MIDEGRARAVAGRFWARVDRSDDPVACWLWTGHRSGGGYGSIRCRGEVVMVHRLAWTLTNGEIPDGLFVLHRCDIRHCVRPDHLWLGTNGDNLRDMALKGRAARGLANGMNTHPERRPRGDRSGRRTHAPKLSATTATVIRGLRGTEPLRVTAARYGVSRSTVSQIQRGERWAPALADALLSLPADDPARRFVLPADSSTDDEVRQWIANKQRLLNSKRAAR